MKMYLTALVLLTFTLTGAYSQVEFRMFAESSSGKDQSAPGWERDEDNFNGLGWDLIMGKVGIGTRALVRFDSAGVPGDRLLDFEGTGGVSYHLFGTGPFDLFGEAGLGAVGRVNLTRGVDEVPGQDLTGLNLGLFPYWGTGAAFRWDNFVLGVRAQWHKVHWAVPAAPIQPYPLGDFSMGLFFGLSTGPVCFDRKTEVAVQPTPPVPLVPPVPDAPVSITVTIEGPSDQQDKDRARELVREE